MLGATATIIMAGLGMAGNAIQAVRANKQQKDAQAAAKQYANDIKGIQETNFMAGLQSADIKSLAEQQVAQNVQQGMETVKGAGAEAVAGGVGNIVAAGNEAALKAAQAQGVQDMNVEHQIASTQQGIESRRAGREGQIGLIGLQGAQQAAMDAQSAKAGAISGMFNMAGLGIQGVDQATALYQQDQDELINTNNPNANQGYGFGTSGASF